ncbi:MAG: bacteriohemerythrin [Candidatus Xenobiia bacterium LiM19]
MPLITWSDKISVHVKEFDEHHKKLVGYVNDINDAMQKGKGKEVIPPILVKLMNYTKVHFSREEEMMKKYSYPEYAEHKSAHDRLITEVEKLKLEYEKGSLSVPIKMLNFLHMWLVDHIQHTDRRYGAFFNGKGIS